ncbi:MAG TPA: hypothetical protein VMV46_15645 [Thermoanaerobaculia bacterium]|nr:hypothetical protein [Thermoanaerobaculia bacterium]
MLACSDLARGSLAELFAPVGIEVVEVAAVAEIPGSHWGAPEAGIGPGQLWVRADTPVHSALHEGAHLVCMGAQRRRVADTDAGGDELEESAVCYLQILMADELPEVGRERLMWDMDAWGYSFRLGSTRAWFEEDAEDAKEWLEERREELGWGELLRGRGDEIG